MYKQEAIRFLPAISLGGDADTMACIAGGISEAYYGGVPESVELSVRELLASDLLAVVDRFRARYCLAPKQLLKSTSVLDHRLTGR